MSYLLGNYTSEGGPGVVQADENGLGRPVGLADPSWIVPGRTGLAYAVLERDAGAVQAIDYRDGLRPLGAPRATAGTGPCHGALDSSGQWLMVANYGSASVSVFGVEPSGELGDVHSVLHLEGSGPDSERQETSHPHQILVHGSAIYIVDLGGDAVLRGRMSAAGDIEVLESHALPPGFGPRHAAIDGNTIYIASELSNQLARCYISENTTDNGRLTTAEFLELPRSSQRCYPLVPVIDSDRGAVYVPVRGSDTVVSVDMTSFAVTGNVPCGGRWPRDAVLLRPGCVRVACQFDGVVTDVDVSGAREPRTIWRVPGASRVLPVG